MKILKTDTKPQIVISVRNLVEFLLVSGDIDERVSASRKLDAMQEGNRIHRKLQRRAGSSYHAEVPLKFLIEYEEYTLGIEGRADGIIYDGEDISNSSVTIDEIKGMYLDVQRLEEPFEVHLAQAKCYAYFVAEKYDLEEISVQMTYCNLDTEDIKRFEEQYSFDELESWFYDLIAQYKKWANYLFWHRKERLESIQGLPFPYPYREGQHQLVADVYRSITRGKILFSQAPTGTGKTLATIYPAIQAVGQGCGDKIFYLTAKTSTTLVARDAFSLLEEKGYAGNTVCLTAKDKMCPHEKRICDPEHCSYAKGHFDRVNDAVFASLSRAKVFDRQTILDLAEEFLVCPFEFSLDLSNWVDHIVCDYNYVFDPNAYLRRFFAEGKRRDDIFLVDESHNLVERAREMYSETLIKEDFLAMKRQLKPFGKKLENALQRCNKILLEYKRKCERYLLVENLDTFLFALMNVGSALDELLQRDVVIEDRESVLEFYFKVRNFLALSDCADEHYRIYCDFTVEGNFAIHLFCVDPSLMLQERLERAKSTVFFSATLLPVNYYKQLLCRESDVYAVYTESMFDKKKRRILIGDDVSSVYKERGIDMYQKYARYIKEITEAKVGNYMVFCPSYQFMKNVEEQFLAINLGESEILMQKASMTEPEREDFLYNFEMEKEHSLIAFCVMGGIFSEGIDLTGEKLIGTIVVGAGLPQVSVRQEIMTNYFEDSGRDGFAFSYLYPGMNKVIQSAGRLIRTAEDVGVIALLDWRFTKPMYQSTFPKEWSDAKRCNLKTVGEEVRLFWESFE